MKKGLIKYIGLAAAGLAMLLSPGKVEAQELNGPTPLEVIGNPFSQHNNQIRNGLNKYNHPHSGDVDNDGEITWEDVSAIDTTSNLRANLNINSFIDVEDKQILVDYLNGKIDYLPTDWNNLPTEEKKRDVAQKLRTLEGIISWDGGVCGDFTTQMQIDLNGIANAKEYIEGGHAPNKDISYTIGKNYPFYQAGTINTGGVPHGVLTILVGDNPLDFNDWMFFGYNKTEEIHPGDFNMNENSPVSIGGVFYYQNFFGENKFGYLDGIIQFQLDNGVPSEGISQKEYYLTTHNPNKIKVKSGDLENMLVNYNTNLDLSPEALKNAGYNSIPSVETENFIPDEKNEYNDKEPKFNYTYSEKKPLSENYPNINYEVDATGYWSLYVGGITKQDSSKWKITVGDYEKPKLKVPNEIEISKNDKMTPEFIGYPEISDNSGLPVDTSYSYELVSNDGQKEIYNVYWTARDKFGNDSTDVQKVTRNLGTVGVDDYKSVPLEFRLSQNYPNPFNPTTKIQFTIPVTEYVVLKIYNTLGQEINTLVNEEKTHGSYEVSFVDQGLPNGIYYYRIKTGKYSEVKKMILLK